MVILPRWFYIKTIINQTFNDIFFAIERLCETLDIKITKRLQPLDLDKKNTFGNLSKYAYIFLFTRVLCVCIPFPRKGYSEQNLNCKSKTKTD